jgi:hypothetical protein
LGEALIALLFAFAAVPVSLAAGSSVAAALQAAATWSVVFIAGTATVHALLTRKKRGALAPTLCAAALVFGLSTKRLRLLGWSMVFALPIGGLLRKTD